MFSPNPLALGNHLYTFYLNKFAYFGHSLKESTCNLGDWLLWPSMSNEPGFIYIGACCRISFLLINCQTLFYWTEYHIELFSLFAIMMLLVTFWCTTNVDINLHFSWVYIPRVRISEPYTLCLTFLGPDKLFWSDGTIYILSSSAWEFHFFHIFTSIFYYVFLFLAIIVVLICIS